jgi:tetratricopeptide (TPR) repeat protein
LIYRCAADAPTVFVPGGRDFLLPAAAVWGLAAGCDFCGRPAREVNRLAGALGAPHRICDHCTALALGILEEQGVELQQGGSQPFEIRELPEVEGALDALRELGLHADVLPVLLSRVRALLDDTKLQKRDSVASGSPVCSFCFASDSECPMAGPRVVVCSNCIRCIAPHLWHTEWRRAPTDLKVPIVMAVPPASELRKQVRRLATDPDDPRSWFRVGWTYADKGDDARALAAFGKAAILFAASGYLLKALATWRKVLEIDPSSAEARAARQQLQEALGLDTHGARVEEAPRPAPEVRERIRTAFASPVRIREDAVPEGVLDTIDPDLFRHALPFCLLRALETPGSPASTRLLLHLCPGRVAATGSDCLGSQVRGLTRAQIEAVVAFLEHMLAVPRAREQARDVAFALETFWRPLAWLAR